jgi:hypothetical protein
MAQCAAKKAISGYAQNLKKLVKEAHIEFLEGMKEQNLKNDHAFAGFPEMKSMQGEYLFRRERRQ